MEEWLRATAADLGRGIEAGSINPVELTEAYLSAISRHDYSNRIYARVMADLARAQAKAAAERAKSGVRRSPLDGVPISWKDLFDTAGVATEAGTRLLKGRIPDRDARALANASAAGLVCLGKTHMTELAFSGLGLNPMTASPPCINDVEAVSGGSSSGAAASVAFELAAAGIGSDTGGSVRVPSVWNDLVGLKTISGRLSLDGVVPLCPSFDTVGPLCRSVEDAGLLLAVMENGRTADLSGASLKNARLAVLKTSAFDNLRDAPRAAFQSAVERLQNAGTNIQPIELNCVSEAMALAPKLYPVEAYGTWKHLIDENPGAMFAAVRERFESGSATSGPEFVAAWQTLLRCRAEYAVATAGFDAVVLPTCPITPPKIAAVSEDHELFVSENLLALQNTRIGNLLGLAGLTLPTGVPSCGILFQGHSEERLLRLGTAAEKALS